jgi:hypothetical protein
MGRPKTMRLSCDKVDNSRDITSSYVQGEKIKKMLKASSYSINKDEVVVQLENAVMDLDHACYLVDLLSRVNTAKAYDIVLKHGISKLNLNKLKSYV